MNIQDLDSELDSHASRDIANDMAQIQKAHCLQIEKQVLKEYSAAAQSSISNLLGLLPISSASYARAYRGKFGYELDIDWEEETIDLPQYMFRENDEEPTISYQAVAPVNHNQTGSAFHDDEAIHFTPMADNATFARNGLRKLLCKVTDDKGDDDITDQHLARRLAWAQRLPYDSLFVEAEWLRRCLRDPLICKQDSSIESIAEGLWTIQLLGLDILSSPLNDEQGVRGLVRRMARNDMPDWVGQTDNPSGLYDVLKYQDTDNIFTYETISDSNAMARKYNSKQKGLGSKSAPIQNAARLTSLDKFYALQKSFCRVCVQPKCQEHALTWHPPPPLPEPTVFGWLDAAKTTSQPCHYWCFQKLPDFEEDLRERVPLKILSDDELEDIQSFWLLSPDIAPCTVAEAFRIPCFQAWSIREQTHETSRAQSVDDASSITMISNNANSRITGHLREMEAQRTHLLMDDRHEFDRATRPPCSHTAPCDEDLCLCVRDDHHCEKACLCPPECPRRWRGCGGSCRKGGCQWGLESDCICVKRRRECDPSLCGCCARLTSIPIPKGGREAFIPCENIQFQEGLLPRIQINSCEWNLGAFALEPIRKGRLIGEYTGEFFNMAHRNMLAVGDPIIRAMRRNYQFTTVQDGPVENPHKGIIDASYAGNMIRFLNDTRHGKFPQNPANNCYAHLTRVHGVHKMLIFADSDIGQGEELTLWYGEEYWLDPEANDDNVDGELPATQPEHLHSPSEYSPDSDLEDMYTSE
ncbi:hypothetical protein DL96DRAFT_1605392 [Flagelloscypha sp. PMI_526]|nr:hypothetical protein DL96DRAFT_1605392 [Flagelloscypha sp. PMI_526]